MGGKGSYKCWWYALCFLFCCLELSCRTKYVCCVILFSVFFFSFSVLVSYYSFVYKIKTRKFYNWLFILLLYCICSTHFKERVMVVGGYKNCYLLFRNFLIKQIISINSKQNLRIKKDLFFIICVTAIGLWFVLFLLLLVLLISFR